MMGEKKYQEEYGQRFRLCFFNYGKDIPGKHYYRGPVSGYFWPDNTVDIAGWVVPNGEVNDKALEIEIIQGGRVIECIPIVFLMSGDVYDRFPEIAQAKNARYKFTIPLHFLKCGEYVVRLWLTINGSNKIRLWDMAFIEDHIFIKPVFVLGSPRAGTTAVGNALRHALGAKNYGEHHFLYLSSQLNSVINDYFSSYHTRNDKGTFINDISPALMLAKVGQQTKELYDSWQEGDYFVDKTPGRNMIRSISSIQTIWPEAKYVFCKRRAYENILSRLEKFPHVTLEEHAHQWVEVMAEWRQIRNSILANHFVEIDQEKLKDNNYLGHKRMSGMFECDIYKELVDYLSAKFPQQSRSEARVLTKQESDTVLSICKAEMEIWGYSTEYHH